MATNRHQYFKETLETLLETITGFNVLTEWNLANWKTYEFPWVSIELQPDSLTNIYEDQSDNHDFDAKQEFIIWIGIAFPKGQDKTVLSSDVLFKIEKAFHNYKMPIFSISDYKVNINATQLTTIHPILDFGEDEYLCGMQGIINYNLKWLN